MHIGRKLCMTYVIACETAHCTYHSHSRKGVGTAGATGALVSAMLKPRGWKYLFTPAIIWRSLSVGYKQFCVSGLQGKPAHLKNTTCTKTRRPRLRPGPNWGNLYSAPQTPSWWTGGLPQYRPSQRTPPWLSLSDFEGQFLLISFRRHCTHESVCFTELRYTWVQRSVESVCMHVWLGVDFHALITRLVTDNADSTISAMWY